MEYYSAIKRNEVLTRATVCINLKKFMLNEMSQIKEPILYDPTYMNRGGHKESDMT